MRRGKQWAGCGGSYGFWRRSTGLHRLKPLGGAEGGNNVDCMAGFSLAIKRCRVDVSPSHPRSMLNLYSCCADQQSFASRVYFFKITGF